MERDISFVEMTVMVEENNRNVNVALLEWEEGKQMNCREGRGD